MTDPSLTAARRLYDAVEAHDGRALLEALSPSFRGGVCAGMPRHLGGVYDGRERMLAECWSQVSAAVEIHAVPEEYLPSGTDRMVVTGRYVGSARGTGRALDAAFVHVLRFADGRVSEIVQITDTARWHEGLRP
jgi:ketosteroid isomerase-like protein